MRAYVEYMKYYRHITLALIALTTLPFFLLFGRLDFSLLQSESTLSFFWTQLASIVGSIAGLIGIMLCCWQVLLGSRMITRHVSPDLLWFNRIHQLIGIYGGAFVLVHPLLEAYAYGESVLFALSPSFASEFATYVTFGRIASMCFYIVWITSAVVRGKIRYRPWLYVHYFSYAVVIFALLHVRTLGTVLASYPLLRTFFFVLLPCISALIIFRILYSAGVFQKKYRVAAVQHVGQVVMFQVVPFARRLRSPLAGQFCYVQLKPFGEAHPFSVMDYDAESGAFTFGIKSFGRYSKKMFDIMQGTEIFLDGPFGVFCAEGRNTEPKILIAGGIGITPLYHLVRAHGNTNTYMLNCNRTLSEAIGRDVLKFHLGNRYVDVLSNEQIDDACIACGQLSEDILRQHIPADLWGSAQIFFCGNPGFYAATKVMLLRIGVPESHIHFEAFSL